jgi:hypothetical protein
MLWTIQAELIHDPRSTIHDPRPTIHDPRSTTQGIEEPPRPPSPLRKQEKIDRINKIYWIRTKQLPSGQRVSWGFE